MNEVYVAVKAKAAGVTLLTKSPAAMNWGTVVTMPLSAWRSFVEAYSFSALRPDALKAWQEVVFLGYPEAGVWLRHVNKAAVLRHTRNTRDVGDAVFVSKVVYEEMRSKYYPWWQKTHEQEGWDLVPPRAMYWAKSGEARPAEITSYRAALAVHDFNDGMPANDSEIMRMAVRCDPSMKLYKLVLAKQKK